MVSVPVLKEHVFDVAFGLNTTRYGYDNKT